MDTPSVTNNDFELVKRDGMIVAVRDLDTGRTCPMVAGGEGDDEGKDGDADRDDGDAGVGDEGATERDAAGDGGDDDSGDGEGDAGRQSGENADPEKVIAGLRKRLKKLTAQKQRGAEAARERDALKAKLGVYEKRERDAEEALKQARERTPEGQAAAKAKADVRRAIDETYGTGTSEWLERRRSEESAEEDRRVEEYTVRGLGYLREELEAHGIKVTDAKMLRWERAIGSEMAEDRDLAGQYKRPASQKEAVQEAVKRVRDGLVNPELKERNVKPLERVARNREALLSGGRGAAAEGAPEPTFDLKPPKELKGRELDQWWSDQREKAWDRLSQAE